MWGLIRKILIFIFIILILAYLFLVFILPKIINSNKLEAFTLDKIKQKSGYDITLKDFDFKTDYALNNEITLKEMNILNKKKRRVLYANNITLNFKPFHINPNKVKINYLFFDKTNFSKANSRFKLEKLPQITLNKADIILQKDSKLTLYNLKGIKEEQHYSISFRGFLKSKYISKSIELNSNKNIIIKNKILSANNLALIFHSSPLVLSGKLYDKGKFDVLLQGVNIPAKSVQEVFLFYRKQVKPKEKNFIENFYDFKGLAQFNLRIRNKSLDGTAALDNFAFKSVKFDVPFYYKRSVFYFKKDKVSLKTQGLFGQEKLYTDLFATNIFSIDRITQGSLISIATDDLALKHLPDTRIIGTPRLSVKYIVQRRKPKVFYLMTFKKGEDISYKNISLNSIQTNRTIKANTIKIENKLYLKNYTYFIADTPTLEGLGEFTKVNNKFHLDFITLNTIGYVPIKILGKYSKLIEDGIFRANLKYNAVDKELLGNLNFKINSLVFKKLKLKNIDLSANIKNNNVDFTLQNLTFDKPFSDFLFGRDSKFKLKKFLSKKDLNKIKCLDFLIWGNFDLDIKNKLIDNIDIYCQNKFLSAFLEGCYKFDSKETCLNLWAKYNKKEYKKIKIFYIIPLYWVSNFIFKKESSSEIYKNKIEKIPSIEVAYPNIEIILVNIKGIISDLNFKYRRVN